MKITLGFPYRAGFLAAVAIAVFGAGMSVPEKVLADDTEVFFPPTTINTVTTANPNILFVFDDSGSMAGLDGLPDSRIVRLQIAFRQIMSEISANTNVGLMRFSNTEGGPVIFPVAPVESLIKDVDPSFATITNTDVIAASSGSEAQQVVSTGAVTINQTPLYFGSSGTTLDFAVAQEAEQGSAAGTSSNPVTRCTTLSSPSASCNKPVTNPIQLIKTATSPVGTTSPTQWVGLRFQQVGLPTDFVATDARLVFTADIDDTDPVDLKIFGQKNNQAAPFNTGSNTAANVASTDQTGGTALGPNISPAINSGATTGTIRPITTNTGGTETSGYVAWPGVPAVDQYQMFASPSLADIVNEIKGCQINLANNPLNANFAKNATSFVLKNATPFPSNGTVVTIGAYSGTVTGWTASTKTVTVSAGPSSAISNGTPVTWNDGTVANGCPTATTWQASPTTSQNVLTFLMTGDNSSSKGMRRATSLVSNPASAAKLQVAYTSASAPSSQIITGLQFPNIQIPTGVTLTDAHIDFHQDGLGGVGNLNLKITIEQADNAQPYSATTSNISSRSYAGARTASWTVPAWNVPFTTQSTTAATSPNALKDLINQVTSRAGWCGGQAIAFKIEVDAGSDAGAFRRAFSSAMNGAWAPTLSYTYATDDPALATGCASGQGTSVQISSGNDDGESRPIGTTDTFNATSLNLGCKGACTSSSQALVGLRFPGVAVPAGATIQSAYIDFGASGASSGTANLTIYGEDSGNAPALNAAGLSTVRNGQVLSQTVNWSTAAAAPNTLTDWVSGQTYTTPDLTAIVQKMVQNTNWNTGHAMAFFIDGSGSRVAYSREGKASAAPKLRITYMTTVGKMTVRNYLKILVNQLTPYSWTPSVGTLYEAARYFRGEGAFYGLTRGFGSTLPSSPSSSQLSTAQGLNVSHPSTFAAPRPTHVMPAGCTSSNLTAPECALETYSGTAKYKSPITDTCQSNSLVFLTDGYPNYNDAISKVQTMTGAAACRSVDPSGNGGVYADGGTCAEELSKFLATTDQSTVFSGPQYVNTYTIGFSFPGAQDWLTKVATNGNGSYFTATSSADLVSAFRQIVSSILDINTTFVSPAVTVNTFNRLTNRNELYFAVFKPDTDIVWNGNLKRYQLFQTVNDASPTIYDSNSPPLQAVDSTTGFFKDGTRSFWTPSTINDGGDVTKGGAASQMVSPRTIYTYVGGTSPSNVDLTTSANQFVTSNTAVTATMMGMPATATATDRSTLMSWALGTDVLDENKNGSTTDTRLSLGDPLHSEPVLITYGGTDAAPDTAIFMGTNQDGLHAFNAATGTEYFSFMPTEALSNLYSFYTDVGSYTNRPYGVDGPITTWVNDGGDGVISGSDFAYIYAGLRRGGRSYYALDVTSRTRPILKFQIAGGAGGYTELGQTWSRAVHARIRIGGANKDVLIFSGGYDPSEDGNTNNLVSAASQGRALFVADASTGALLWWAGYDPGTGTNRPNLAISGMNYSIPSSPKAVDLDNDGLVDRIYLADTGGQIFRIVLGKDSSNIPSLSNAYASRIATLSGTTAATAHRFFSTPNVAMITQGTSKPFISISIGSGFHEHPLSTVNADRFYILRDPEITNDGVCKTGVSTCTPLFVNGEADLYDATTLSSTAAVDITGKKGLYLKLGTGTNGEKSVTEATTFNNQVLFATFQPGTQASNTCTAAQGVSRLYQVSVIDGSPTQALSQPPGTDPSSVTLTAADRSMTLTQGGLPPNPTILFPSISSTKGANGLPTAAPCIGSSCPQPPNSAIVCVGPQCFSPGLNIPTVKTFWRKVEN